MSERDLITLPREHNWTERRFSRSLLEAFQSDHADCIERPSRHGKSRWALRALIAFTVVALVLLSTKEVLA